MDESNTRQRKKEPDVIYKLNGVTYQWKVSTIWKAAENLPVQLLPLSDFEWEMGQDRWFKSYIQPTVLNILGHHKRILDADLRFPIIVCPNGFVLDGMHRICKAWLLGKQTIKAKRLPKLPDSEAIDIDRLRG